MEPQTPVTLSPYRKGVCWHGVKPAERQGPARFCGVPCGKFRVTRFGYNATAGPEVSEMWLCTLHKQAMEKRGYAVVSIP